MLQVSEAAAELLKSMRRDLHMAEGSGVRLEPSKEQPGALGIAFREEPETSDQVIEESGLRVFVAEDVAPELEERTLDVQTTPEGVALSLR